ncbi:hypothetical protein ASE27_09475 [Oerskovia sp. Root918]|uniref:hypothetical protein n=1 Tax=unclassified Oerskovia TaxID=2619021 RepID=UPI0006F731E7|nr:MULTISPECIES: hypothetical protein [unclassified Oerskovia]KRC35451.1 hypothetical protein ASE15_09815 [Oerskovia sp. Root22]KRD36702.1 hypothetical protein ASE27_09475 [Oerskovia sp. Root918]
METPNSWTTIVENLADAARAGEHEAFFAAGQRLADSFVNATREDLDAAVVLLAPVLTEARGSLGGTLAQYIGSLVGMDGDATPVLDTLVERACTALDSTHLFVSLHEELVGPVPDRDDCGDREYEAFVSAAAHHISDPGRVAGGWMNATSWVQPVLVLLQRADVRRSLPQKERLTAAAIAAHDLLPDLAPWMLGLLRILDDDTVIVLHRETGVGFRATITGVADNFQLHTLLAAQVLPLLPAPRQGLFRRRDTGRLPDVPTSAMVAAADGSGEYAPEGGIVGQFNLVDAAGDWIWNEGRPDDIPLVDGVRVVVLDPPPYQRGWDSGRAYPLLRARVEVAPLPTAEATAWLSRVAPSKTFSETTSTAAPEWTGDMTVPLPTGRDVAGLVARVQALVEDGTTDLETEATVAREFSLTSDDAALVVGRFHGGAARAATGNEANLPDPAKDPIAYESYRQALQRTET